MSPRQQNLHGPFWNGGERDEGIGFVQHSFDNEDSDHDHCDNGDGNMNATDATGNFRTGRPFVAASGRSRLLTLQVLVICTSLLLSALFASIASLLVLPAAACALCIASESVTLSARYRCYSQSSNPVPSSVPTGQKRLTRLS